LAKNFDVVVLGAGSGGYAAALRAAQLGKSVALIEQDLLGGTCLHRGCIPTKALLHSGEIADSVRESHDFGIKADLIDVDMTGVNSYKDSVVAKLYKGLQGLVKHRGITYVTGRGKFIAPNQVQVGGETYVGKSVVLATGSYPKSIPGLEVDGKVVITSEQAINLSYVPSHVIVLGGGVIGVEFASVWRSLGAEVTVIEGEPRLIPTEDEASSKGLERAYRKRGIKMLLGVTAKKVDSGSKKNDQWVEVELSNGEKVKGDLLLVAVGRGAATTDQGFSEAGLEMEGPLVKVTDRQQTNLPNVYAVGDIVRGPQLAHKGFAEGVFVAEQIAGLSPTPIDMASIPRVTYCEPEVASVGLTEAQAKAKFGDGVKAITYDLAGNGKSQILKTAGFVKLVAAPSGAIVGVHILGSRAGELLAEGQLLYSWQATADDVAPLVHAHPTMSESMGEAAMALAGKPLHAHG
jgi:dihydrolipoamide dehydrogenase